MGEQCYKEFHSAERVAMEYLMAPQTLPKADSLDRWRFLLRLWHYPAFQESRSWGIFRLHEKGSRQIRTLLRQVTWDRQLDARRFTDPLLGLEKGFHTHPTIEVADRPIENALLDERLTALRQIAFSAFSARSLGLDGEIFGIAIPENGVGIEWWCEGPDSWGELTEWASKTREWLCSIASGPPQKELWELPRPRLP